MLTDRLALPGAIVWAFLWALTALSTSSPCAAQGPNAASPNAVLVVDAGGGESEPLTSSLSGLLIARGFGVVDPGAVMAARAHLFGSLDAPLDPAMQAALVEALGAEVLIRIQLLPVEGQEQTAVQLNVTGAGGTSNQFLLAQNATLLAQVLEASAALEGLRIAPVQQAPVQPGPAPVQPAVLEPAVTPQPTEAESEPIVGIGQRPEGAAGQAPVAAPANGGVSNAAVSNVAGGEGGAAPAGVVAGQLVTETNAGFWWSAGARISLMSFPDGGWVDGFVNGDATAGYAFTDSGWGVGAIASVGSPSMDKALDGFFSSGAGLFHRSSLFALGYSTFLNGSVFFGTTSILSLSGPFGLSLGAHAYINPDQGSFVFTVGLGLGFSRAPVN